LHQVLRADLFDQTTIIESLDNAEPPRSNGRAVRVIAAGDARFGVSSQSSGPSRPGRIRGF
jgi:hypothetical protein